jgi:hypothetical protein
MSRPRRIPLRGDIPAAAVAELLGLSVADAKPAPAREIVNGAEIAKGAPHGPADDAAIPLRDIPALFPESRFTLSTLRAEASRGRLQIFRVGRRDYTTPADVREMIRRCRADDHRRAFISTRQGVNGSSATAEPASALAALRQSVGGRKSS